MRSSLTAVMGLLGLAAAACGGAGLGDAVRNDVTARMATTQAPVAACYETALVKNRRLKGMMVVAFTTKPGSGEFSSVRIVRDDLADPELAACVVTQVSGLKLATPTKTAQSIEYPLSFAPLN